MKRLTGAQELLDGPLDDPATLVGNLRDLRRINAWLGGARLSHRAVLGFQPDDGSPLRVLDVGTGGADIPVRIRRDWPRGLAVPAFVVVDSRPEVLAAARVADPSLDASVGVGSLEMSVADGRALPWPDDAFDVAHASMVLHHLDLADAVPFLRELGRVGRRGVVVNDLDRARIHWLGAWLISHLFTRNALTRYDAPMSVRRAYTVREVAALLRAAGLRPISVRRGFLRHRYAISAVRAGGGASADVGRSTAAGASAAPAASASDG